METNEVKVNWIQINGKKCLNMEINGFLEEKIAFYAVSRWKKEFIAHLESGEKGNVVCNCLNMSGYDTEARKLWQQTISDLKFQIECMWIITDNALFTIAAKTMGLMTKFKIKTAKSEAEIHIE